MAVNATPSPRMNPTRAPPPADHWPTHEITFAITNAITTFATNAVTYIHGSGCALRAAICSGVSPSPAVYGPLSAVNQPACANQSTIAATITAPGFTLFIRAPPIQQHSIGAPLSLGNLNSRLDVRNIPLFEKEPSPRRRCPSSSCPGPNSPSGLNLLRWPARAESQSPSAYGSPGRGNFPIPFLPSRSSSSCSPASLLSPS